MNSFENTWKIIIPGPFLEDLVLINEILHQLGALILRIYHEFFLLIYNSDNTQFCYDNKLCYNTTIPIAVRAHGTHLLAKSKSVWFGKFHSHQYAGAGEVWIGLYIFEILKIIINATVVSENS